MTQPIRKGNSHRVNSVQPTGVIQAGSALLASSAPRCCTDSTCFPPLFSIGEALRAAPCVPFAAPRALPQSVWKDVRLKRVLVMDFGCNCLQCTLYTSTWCSGLFCF